FPGSLSPRPRPATSTLFPYTTLFRSQMHVVVFDERDPTLEPGLPRVGVHALQHLLAGLVARVCLAGKHDLDRARHTRATSPASRDRKSTRLNSSHLVISYAVFCLKKK